MSGDEFPTITITKEKVKQWQKEADDLLKTIQTDTARHALLLNRINAVRLFVEPTESALTQSQPSIAMHQNGNGENLSELSPPDAIVAFLRKADRPIPVNALRHNLLAAGYPREKLGQDFAYFYTVVKRLKQSGKIIKDGLMLRVNTNA